MTECTGQVDLFSIRRHQVTASFEEARLSSDAGVLLLRGVDRQLGLSSSFAKALSDRRDSAKVVHQLQDLARQRVFQICCGYEDVSDATALRNDAAFQTALDKIPGQPGASLASQPTLSRFERRSRRELHRLGDMFLDQWIRSVKRRARRSRKRIEVVLDFDSTDFEAHGAQQFALFHGHYDGFIFLPLVVFDQYGYPVAAILRPGRSPMAGVVGLLRRIHARLEREFRSFQLTIRADAGFCSPSVYALCEELGIQYLIGIIKHPSLISQIEPLLGAAREEVEKTGKTFRLFSDFRLKWGKKSRQPERRFIAKAEVTPLGDNPRFLITNMSQEPEWLYLHYTERGQTENFIKDLKNALAADRMSCHDFRSNQFRLFLHLAAYVLMFELRERLAPKERRMQMDTLRIRLLKVAAEIRVSARRIWIRMSSFHPGASTFRVLAERLAPDPT